jgi:hypothetical protein
LHQPAIRSFFIQYLLYPFCPFSFTFCGQTLLPYQVHSITPRGAISMTAFVFNEINFDNHEQVVFASEEKSGLKAIIAVHNTHLGPAMGGCRMWNYASEAEAVRDVLRLSRGMTYKNAVAGLPIGGGKSVIIGNPKTDKTPALFEALGEALSVSAVAMSRQKTSAPARQIWPMSPAKQNTLRVSVTVAIRHHLPHSAASSAHKPPSDINSNAIALTA